MRILKKKHWPGMVDMPHSEKYDTISYREIVDWCNENVGNKQFYIVNHYSNHTFYFRKEEDATLFALKWS